MNCIINAAWGQGYSRGQRRLIDSLRSVGYKGEILTWDNVHINEHHDVNHPYTMKAAAFEEAKRRGFKNVLWLDCSIVATRPIDVIFSLMESDGFYFWKSGWRLSNSATDKDLEIGCISRDEADTLDECASGIVGLNFSNYRALAIYTLFIDYNAKGVCSTSRLHDGQSSDPRFFWGRQDQTALTMAFHNARQFESWPMFDHNIYSSYWERRKRYPKSVCLLVKGL